MSLVPEADAQGKGAPSKFKGKDRSADLFLNVSQVGLGERVSREGERSQFLATIDLEKERLTRKMLKNIFENAYDMYREGNFEGARELTATILAIDPHFEEAAFLQKASRQLEGTQTPRLSERRLAEDRFQEGLSLYQDGRVVEASNRWREVTVLSPGNLKARYWLRRANQDIAEEHFQKGQELYRQGRLRESLDQFYAAFVRYPSYPRLESIIADVEARYQSQEAQVRLQEALSIYGKGDLDGTVGLLRKVLELSPGNSQASNLYAQVRAEMAGRSADEAKRLAAQKQYNEAIEAWKRAAASGFDASDVQEQISRIREASKRDELRKKEEIRLAREREKEAKEAEQAKKEEKEEKKKSGASGTIPTIQQIGRSREAEEPAEGPGTAEKPAEAPTQPAPPAQASRENKENSVLHYQNAMISYQKGQLDGASNEVSLALQLDPANADADTLRQMIEQKRNP